MSLDRTEIIARLRDRADAIRGLGVTTLDLYGSRARGDNRQTSDLDVLIDYDHDRKFSVYDLVAVKHLIEEVTSLPVHISTREDFSDGNLRRIARDAVRVL